MPEAIATVRKIANLVFISTPTILNPRPYAGEGCRGNALQADSCSTAPDFILVGRRRFRTCDPPVATKYGRLDIQPKTRRDKLKGVGLETSRLVPAPWTSLRLCSVRDHDPGGRVVARFSPAADFAIDACADQMRGRGLAQKQM